MSAWCRGVVLGALTLAAWQSVAYWPTAARAEQTFNTITANGPGLVQPMGAQDTRVRGTVLIRTSVPARAAARIPITVRAKLGGLTIATVRAMTDARGRFTIEVPRRNGAATFVVSAEYEGVSYSATLSGAQAGNPVDLAVYGATSSDAGLAVMRFVVGLRRRGHSLAVIEDWTYANAGTAAGLRTVIGSNVVTGRAAATFPLPAGAQHITIRDVGPPPASAVVNSNTVVVNTVLRPASGLNPESLHRLTATLDVPVSAGHPSLLIPTRYFVGSMYVFAVGSRLFAPGFAQTSLPLGRQNVPALTAHAVAPGSTVPIGVDGPPPTAPSTLPVFSGPFPTTLVAALAGAGFLALIAIGWLGGPRPRSDSHGRLDLQRERARLIGAIAELDLQHARGDVAPDDYSRRRGRQLGILVEVVRQLGE